MIGFEAFMSNPSWKAIYDNAPTELLKKYYELHFNSHPDYVQGSKEEITAEIKALESQFTEVEWQYLLDTTENITAKIHYKKMLESSK